jgi:5-(aminomethyl)-3-furanmethanol phosphate kinase
MAAPPPDRPGPGAPTATSPAAPWTVVKVGGSLLDRRELPELLAGLGTRRLRPVAIVPGGGVFADAVRAAQRARGFDDSLAHRLALDAMGQMAQVLASLAPRAAILADPDDFPAAHAAGAMPIWTPSRLKAGHPAIPETWAVTSDSLALFLATAIRAERLVLLKAVEAPAGADLGDLSADGLVDAAFPAFATRFRGAIEVAGPSRWAELSRPESAPA